MDMGENGIILKWCKKQDVTVCTVRHLALEGVQFGGHVKMVSSLEASYVAIKCESVCSL